MNWLLAQTALAETQTRTVVELSRLRQFSQWWHWLLLVSVCVAIVLYITWLYRRDTRNLPRGVRWGLSALRVVAFLALLAFFLDVDKRTERKLTRPSCVAALIDTSQSMGLVDAAEGGTESRLQQVIREFQNGDLLPDLLKKHDVVVYRFDATNQPEEVAAFAREPNASLADDRPTSKDRARQHTEARLLFATAAGLALIAVLCVLAQWIKATLWRGREGEAYLLLAGTVLGIMASVVAAVANLRYPDVTLAEVVSGRIAPSPEAGAGELGAEAMGEGPAATAQTPQDVAWDRLLAPRGVETRLGDAIRSVIQRETNRPLAGVIVMTDGCHNAGVTPASVVSLVKNREIGLYPIGLGSERQPRQVRLVDFEAPPRVYPGDRFNVTGYVQANGLADRPVRVKLQKYTLDDTPVEPPVIMDRQVRLGDDGEIVPVQFEVLPDQPGRHKWVLQVEAREADDLDTRDNRQSETIEVVQRQSRILLLAGGPMREYRFLRNLLYRDSTTQVDVHLQSAPPGAAQEANRVLLEFPTTREDLFEYDAMVAFDPAWSELPIESLRLIDQWVAEKGGGMVLVAGPVYTPVWSRGGQATDQEKIAIVKDLYPVTFYRSGAATIQLGRVGSPQAWPLTFTEEGQRAPFLALDESPTASEQVWEDFQGVYGYQALRGLKPGAQVFARFSDPQSATSNEQPIYMAGQFYGTGRTFYLGSGEMWRLNALDTKYFEKFYTKLIRYVSQGRLLRDSTRGILLVDKQRAQLGDTITLRASLSDAQYQPLQVEQVTAQVSTEDGQRQTLTLRRLANAERPGMYSGQFTTTREGTYRIDLVLPESESELLTREIKVRLPAREIEQSQRNDALLSSLAQQTSGQYFVGIPAASGQATVAGLVPQLMVKDQVTFLPGTPDHRFEERLMGWLLGIVVGALSVEWLLRRLYRLA